LKEKKDGSIKGRTCADGRKQRGTIPKEEAASPTAALESIFITAVQEAKEGCHVVTLDIPNAFIQTYIEKDDEKIIMILRDRLAEIMEIIAPQIYSKYVQVEKGKKILYVQCQNVIYGTLKAALQFYQKFVKDLKEIGFKINPYDVCVANKVINGKQMTAVWHVDDVKLSHASPQELDIVINHLKDIYEDPEIGMMTVNRGKRHEYLGMWLDYSTPGKVKIDMKDYVEKMINEFSYELPERNVNSPAAKHLFDVQENARKLDKAMAEEFHTMVAKALFLCKRARPDIQVAVAFLTTRVQESDEDDWKKLLRLLQYLNTTKDLVLTLEADKCNIIKWYVDASFGVHDDLRSHTGGTMTLGKGHVMSKSSKQKINTKSSTEAELVGLDDIMPDILWTNYFIDAQGWNYNETVVYQDNKSAILLEKNGKASSYRRTKHINIRYFFVTDRYKRGEIEIEFCPTTEMRADFFTKPLQGKQFNEFRKQIMNLE